MKRTRAKAVVIHNGKILVMFRRKNGKEYYVTPGGGVENGESVEEAVVREVKEETTIDVSVDILLYHHIYDDDTEQYFYLCNYLSGTPKLSPDSIEATIRFSENNFYDPKWIDFNEIKNLVFYPLEIRDNLIKDYKNDFADCPKEENIKVKNLRQ
jgi:8-oxo-dGTP pyrophosphatase MutT (NUDIX family)